MKCREFNYNYIDLVGPPRLTKGLFWSTISFQCLHDGEIQLKGFSKGEAASFFQYFETKYENGVNDPDLEGIISCCLEFQVLRQGYIRSDHLENWQKKYSLPAPERYNFRKDEEEALSDEERKYVRLYKSFANAKKLQMELNNRYVEQQLQQYKELFDNLEDNPLTQKQRESCVIDDANNLIIAGAGSGKTSVIIGRAGYLLISGKATPDEILILAYAKKASVETAERMQKKLGRKEKIHISTFHSLGLSIIGQVTGAKPSLHRTCETPELFNKLIDDYISEQIKSPSYNKLLMKYFAFYLNPVRNDFKSLGEEYEYKKNARIVTLKGEYVKSYQEQHIANFLGSNGINYIYENPYEYRTASANYRQYKPDFYLPDYKIYIEHYAIDKDGRCPSHWPQDETIKYKNGIKWKRQIHTENQTYLIETRSADFDDGTIFDKLGNELRRVKVQFKEVAVEELIDTENEGFRVISQLIGSFLNLFKCKNETIGSVKQNAYIYKTKEDQRRLIAFMDVFEPVYDLYQKELSDREEIDFNDMINHALSAVKSGKFKSPWKYILVDEFQDISKPRAQLVKALRDSGPDASIFCVGDDWQTIYEFAGSDISYTSSFFERFGEGARVDLDLTFRFNNRISDLASRFVMKNPLQLKKTIIALKQEEGKRVTVITHSNSSNQAIRTALKKMKNNKSVYFLGRFKHNRPEIFIDLKSEFPHLEFRYDTVHGSKGREGDYVIIMDVDQGKHGFPTQIQDDPILKVLALDEEVYENAKERRLFYVALTRAKEHTFIITDRTRLSPFVTELLEEKVYFCEMLNEAGQPEKIEDTIYCNKCERGQMLIRVNKNTDHSFFSCSLYPHCSNTMELCLNCYKGPLIAGGGRLTCPKCQYSVRACPQCGTGRLKKKESRYGEFLGCSNYGKLGCNYKKGLRN